MRRADYEIYTFKHNGIQYWAFDVEYFGHYVARSKKEILEKIDVVKLKVAIRLEEIDRLNKEYYERLNRESEKLALALKEYHEFRKANKPDPITPMNRQKMLCRVRDMLMAGATYQEILDAVPDSSVRVVSHVRSHLRAKNLL